MLPATTPTALLSRSSECFARLSERDLVLDNNGQARIVSPNIRRCDIPYVYLVRAIHKTEPLSLLVEVSFNAEDSIAHLCRPYRAAKAMIDRAMPDFYLPSRDDWYVEDRSEVIF